MTFTQYFKNTGQSIGKIAFVARAYLNGNSVEEYLADPECGFVYISRMEFVATNHMSLALTQYWDGRFCVSVVTEDDADASIFNSRKEAEIAYQIKASDIKNKLASDGELDYEIVEHFGMSQCCSDFYIPELEDLNYENAFYMLAVIDPLNNKKTSFYDNKILMQTVYGHQVAGAVITAIHTYGGTNKFTVDSTADSITVKTGFVK